MESVVLGLRLILAGVFAVAGVAKLRDPVGSRRALEDFGLPPRLARPGGLLLPLAEIATAAALIFPDTARWGALAASALLAAFVLAIANAIRRGRAPDCHCFGQLHSEPAGRGTLARNAVLIGAAGTVVAFGPGPAIHTWISDRGVLELALLAVALATSALVIYKIGDWTGRRAAERPSGREVGASAPEFALRMIDGGRRTLAELCARGRPVVLVFVNPECGPCRLLLPQLAEWNARLATRMTIAVLSEGTVDANRSLEAEDGIGDLLLQERGEVYRAYELRQGTPSAVVVDPDRTIASVSVAGPPAIEELVRITLRREGSCEATGATT